MRRCPRLTDGAALMWAGALAAKCRQMGMTSWDQRKAKNEWDLASNPVVVSGAAYKTLFVRGLSRRVARVPAKQTQINSDPLSQGVTISSSFQQVLCRAAEKGLGNNTDFFGRVV